MKPDVLPHIDVIIPVRTVDRYLAAAIDSALAQVGAQCSVIVVDGGSEPAITLTSPHAGEPRIRLVRSDEPLTAGGGRNLGARYSDAPWISFLDADDLCPPTSRRALVDACVRSDADLAVGMMTHFVSDEASRALFIPEGVRRALIAGGVAMTHEAWKRVGEFDPTLRSGEFVEWFNRFSLTDLVRVDIDDLTLERRVHLDSTTAGQIRDRDDYLEVVRRWMNRNSS